MSFISTYIGQSSPKNFKRNKRYATFDESTHCFLMVQKHVTQENVTKTILFSHISSNCCKTNLIVYDNMCLMCPAPVTTHILSLFVKFLMSLLMSFWGKSFDIDS